MKPLILLALVVVSGATCGNKRQQWATGNSLKWSGGDTLWVSPLSLIRIQYYPSAKRLIHGNLWDIHGNSC